MSQQFSATVKSEDDLSFVLVTKGYHGVDHDELTMRVLLMVFWRRNSAWWWPQFPIWTLSSMKVLNQARAQL